MVVRVQWYTVSCLPFDTNYCINLSSSFNFKHFSLGRQYIGDRGGSLKTFIDENVAIN